MILPKSGKKYICHNCKRPVHYDYLNKYWVHSNGHTYRHPIQPPIEISAVQR